jgi:enoyl-CoA hydratase/carnithine racemase
MIDEDRLEIRPDGRPSGVMRRFDLDDWRDADADDVARAAARAAGSLALTVGVATTQPPPSLNPLLDALTLTIAGPGVSPARQLVTIDEPNQAVAELEKSAGRCPRACVALGQLLRQTPCLDTLAGLAAEAAVYSMLLGGPEFAAWLATRDATKPRAAPARPLVRIDRAGHRLSVLLDHPERRNAFSFRMREALYEALELAVADDTIQEVELAGAGPVFSSGGDLAEFGTATDLVAAYLVRLDRAPWRLIDRLGERVTVRTHGAAVGAGIELSSFAGRMVAAPGTYFLLPEIPMGLIPGAGGTVGVPRRIGRWRAAWMMLSAARVDAETTLAWGLIDDLADELDT